MTREEKQTNLRLARRRYSELKTRGERGALLDQFCEMTGLSRKHAIRLLSPHRPKPSGRRGRPRGYGPEVQPLLVRIWELADRPCAKLLVPVLGLWVQSLRRGGQDIPPEVAGALLRMSASSIDRRLRHVRPRAGRGARRASRSSSAIPPRAKAAMKWRRRPRRRDERRDNDAPPAASYTCERIAVAIEK